MSPFLQRQKHLCMLAGKSGTGSGERRGAGPTGYAGTSHLQHASARAPINQGPGDGPAYEFWERHGMTGTVQARNGAVGEGERNNGFRYAIAAFVLSLTLAVTGGLTTTQASAATP